VNWNLGSSPTLEVEPYRSSLFFTGQILPKTENLEEKRFWRFSVAISEKRKGEKSPDPYIWFSL
jgi:hypothetical protein